MSTKLPWQFTEEEKDRQLPYLPTSLQVAPAQIAALQAEDIALDGRLDAVEADLAAATATATPGELVRRDANGGLEAASVTIDTTPTVPQTGAPGKMVWNDVDGTIEFQLGGGNVTLQVGQEQVLKVRNGEVTPLAEGEVVYITGSSGVHNIALRASNATEAASDRTIGVVTEVIGASPGEGYITVMGMVRNIDTNHLTEGALVYLGVGGATTATEPVAPAHQVIIGTCIKKSGGAGVIYVHVTTFPELSELHDVKLTGLATGDSLVYDSVLGYWKNQTAAAAAWLPLVGGTLTGPLGLAASVAGAPGTAALKLPSGPLLLAPEAGAIERLADKYYGTISTGTARKQFLLTDADLTTGRIPFTTTDGRLADSANWIRNATTGQVTQIYNAVGAVVYQLSNTNAAAGAQAYTQYIVDAGSCYFGAESNAGGLSPGGSFVYNSAAKPFSIFTNATKRFDISGAGVLTSAATANLFTAYGKFGLATIGANTLLSAGRVVGNFGGSTAAVHFTDDQLSATVNFQNTNAAGYTAFDFFSSANTKVATFAWGNASSGTPNVLWISTRTATDMWLGTNSAEVLRLRNATKDVELATGNLVLPKTSGVGIKVDPASPSYGWRDLICAIDPKATGGGSPSRVVYRGTIYGYSFIAGDVADFDGFHIPHDYVPGTDLYVHVHWSHNGTAIAGTAAFEVTMTYAKGHNQANFPAEVTQTITVATPDIATVPQYRHRVDEVKASQAGGSATLHNTTDIEVDGLLLGYIKIITLPTITGGNLFIHTVDLHYQSMNMATKNKSPSFYA